MSPARDAGHAPSVQDLEQGRHPEAARSSSRDAVEAAAEAVRCATELLAESGRVTPPAAMRFLPWLVSAAPQNAMAVLQASALLGPASSAN